MALNVLRDERDWGFGGRYDPESALEASLKAVEMLNRTRLEENVGVVSRISDAVWLRSLPTSHPRKLSGSWTHSSWRH